MTDWSAIIDDLIAVGLSKAEIARKLGTYRSRLQRWHDGTGCPKSPYDAKLKALHRSLANQNIRSYEAAIMSSSTLLST